MPITRALLKLAGSCVLASVLVAGMLFPVAGGFGFVSNRAADAVDNVSAELVEGTVPGRGPQGGAGRETQREK
nr:hypothetical protein [Nocardia carnea]